MTVFSKIYSDYRRYIATGGKSKIKIILFNQGFIFTVVFRINTSLYQIFAKVFIVNKLIGLHNLIWLKISQTFSGLSIAANTNIGKGLFISHSGPIIINGDVIIGKNCNIAPMTVIGYGHYNGKYGSPKIADRVFIGPGAKIFGPISIGNNVAIGANATVNKDIPNNAVVVGHNKIVSYKGSHNYIKVDL